MTTFTALTTLTGRAPAEALGEALEALDPAPTGVGVFEIEDGSGLWEVGGYFEARPDPAGLALLATLYGAADFTVSRLDDRDWVAQVRRELTPVEAGRFIVHGAHDAHRVPEQAIGLKIEAAMAFGTGHHGTTRGCLLLLDHLLTRGCRPRRVADIGCGTGVLVMAAAAALRSRAMAADIDAIAVATARENTRANGLHPWIRAVEAAGLGREALWRGGPYDLVFANILAQPLKRLAQPIAIVTAPGGYAILSGLLAHQAPGVEAVYRGYGFRAVRRLRLGEWTSLLLRRRDPLPQTKRAAP
ncbi:MAG: 50S ribosomal protein L11 methyltransferase [Pseudomonadota bacterium]